MLNRFDRWVTKWMTPKAQFNFIVHVMAGEGTLLYLYELYLKTQETLLRYEPMFIFVLSLSICQIKVTFFGIYGCAIFFFFHFDI